MNFEIQTSANDEIRIFKNMISKSTIVMAWKGTVHVALRMSLNQRQRRKKQKHFAAQKLIMSALYHRSREPTAQRYTPVPQIHHRPNNSVRHIVHTNQLRSSGYVARGTSTGQDDGINAMMQFSPDPIVFSTEETEEKIRIKRFVSQVLYREVKFICDQGELDAYHEENTLGYFVMERLNIAERNRARHWSSNKNLVNTQINAFRCNNTNAVKKTWKGKVMI